MTWKVPQIVSTLPIFLQFGLVVFFAGLVDFLHFLYPKLSIVVGVFVGLVILILITILPSLIALYTFDCKGIYSFWLNRSRVCAYQSPQSWVFLQSVLWIFQHIIQQLIWWWCSLPFVTEHEGPYWYNRLNFVFVSESCHGWAGLVGINSFGAWTPYALSWIFQINASRTPEPFWAAYHCFRSLESTEEKMLALHDLANSSALARIFPEERWCGGQLPSEQILQDLEELGTTKFAEEFFSSQLFMMYQIDDKLSADHRVECYLRCWGRN